MPGRPELPPIIPGVYLVGTPIGNLEDITLRALRVLESANVLAAEDTRVTRKLFQIHQLQPPKTIYACNAHTEDKVAERLVRHAQAGKIVAYASDAGMPGISDPGCRIARAAAAAGAHLEVIPGPSAVTTAIAASGINAASFTFLGFPSRRNGRLREELRRHGAMLPALVFYESPHRLSRLLEIAREMLGDDRNAAICLELTKKFERFFRGKLSDVSGIFRDAEVRGEAVVVIAGKRKSARDFAEGDEILIDN
ncbi:MAG: 16S rRNA (cytidine(1402)-2'-O)-methyltransferase [Planctomycetota bacterium]|jgi:16S rRNA (cytidine1402-2'-O)-methyltransferase|nr:16S rRNA (cytidine(1402)-2'-O)-methyltransferase [Planctomycetota bacterium]